MRCRVRFAATGSRWYRLRGRVSVCAVRVYYRPLSARPVRVAWLLEEIGAPYEPISVSTEEAREPEHLARHPLGRVPVLEAEGEVLFESTAICLHLADQHPVSVALVAPASSERSDQTRTGAGAAISRFGC